MKLLVLAGDLTGALDTGMQFVNQRATTRVILDADYPLDRIDPRVDVLVVNTEAQHLPPEQAAEIVQNIVQQAEALGVPNIYQTKDSTLRGIIGAEVVASLPEMMELKEPVEWKAEPAKSFLVLCGSVDRVAIGQMNYAGAHGFRHIRIAAKQVLTPGFFHSADGDRLLAEWEGYLKRGENVILDTNPTPDGETTYDYATWHDLPVEKLPVMIADCVGEILQKLLEHGVESTLLITGRDTLMGFMRAIGISELEPVHEMVPGCVLSKIPIGGRTFDVIYKPGGFGAKEIVVEVAKQIL